MFSNILDFVNDDVGMCSSPVHVQGIATMSFPTFILLYAQEDDLCMFIELWVRIWDNETLLNFPWFVLSHFIHPKKKTKRFKPIISHK